MNVTANGHAKRPMNAGVIGVRTMGQHHARVYSELPAVDLVGIVDDGEPPPAGVAPRARQLPAPVASDGSHTQTRRLPRAGPTVLR